MIEAARTSEKLVKLVNFYQSTRRYNIKHNNLRTGFVFKRFEIFTAQRWKLGLWSFGLWGRRVNVAWRWRRYVPPKCWHNGEGWGWGVTRDKGTADNKACTVHTKDIILQRQYAVVRSLSSYVLNVFGLHSICVVFPSTRKLVTLAKRVVWSRVQ
jgi:hypothetical protein